MTVKERREDKMGIFDKGRPQKFIPAENRGNKPPNKPGIYRIRDKSDKIIYIGETQDLRKRMNEHIRNGKIKK